MKIKQLIDLMDDGLVLDPDDDFEQVDYDLLKEMIRDEWSGELDVAGERMKFEHVDTTRDYEQYWVVVKVGEDLIGMCGYYDSWQGTEWSDADLVDVESYETVEKHWREKV